MRTRHKIKYLFYILSLVVIITGMCVSVSYADSVVGSKHDFSMANASGDKPFAGQFMVPTGGGWGDTINEVCVFCHTPHAASKDSANGTDTLLWNRVSSPPSGFSYKAYSSTTMTNSMSTGKPTGVSMMCMSCHDGVTSIAVNTLLNAPGSGNPAVEMDAFASIQTPGAISNGIGGFGTSVINIGEASGIGGIIDMSNDHPISFDWPAGKAGLQPSATVEASLRLFGGGKRVECATCHRVHDNAIRPFLAMSNDQSLMCRVCHIK